MTRWPQRGGCSLDETLGAPRFPAQQAGAGFLVTGRRRPGRGRGRGVSVLSPRPRQPTATIVNDVATCGSACRPLTTRPRRPGPGPLPGRRTPPGGRGSRRCPCLAGGGSCCRPGSHGGVRVARAGPSTPGRTGAREHARCQHRARRGGKPGQGWPRPPPCLADSPCTEGQAAGLGRPLRLTDTESRLFPTRPPEHRGGGATAPRGLGGAVSSHARDPWRTTPTQAAVPQTSSRTGPARVSRAPRGLGGKAVPACGMLQMQPLGPHRGLRRASVTWPVPLQQDACGSVELRVHTMLRMCWGPRKRPGPGHRSPAARTSWRSGTALLVTRSTFHLGTGDREREREGCLSPPPLEGPQAYLCVSHGACRGPAGRARGKGVTFHSDGSCVPAP